MTPRVYNGWHRQEILEYDSDDEVYRATYDYDQEPPSVAIPIAVMAITGADVTDLPPLNDVAGVDPDALDAVFRPTNRGSFRHGRVTFTYHGFTVTVKSQGRLVIHDPDDPDDRARDTN